MALCTFALQPNGTQACTICEQPPVSKRIADLAEGRPIRRKCLGPGGKKPAPQPKPEGEPGAVRKAWNFAVALSKHVANGAKQRTGDEIQRILRTHCQSCQWYKIEGDNGRCTHVKCGCSVNGSEKFFNKLAWKSESCPIGLWGGEERPPQQPPKSQSRRYATPGPGIALPQSGAHALRFTHGLGDAVQFATVLRYIRRKLPDLALSISTHRGYPSLYTGLCHEATVGGQPLSPQTVTWSEPTEAWDDRPATKIEHWLKRQGWAFEPDLIGYHDPVTPEAIAAALACLSHAGLDERGFCLLHNTPATNRRGKILGGQEDSDEMIALCKFIADRGLRPVVLDWKRKAGRLAEHALILGSGTPHLSPETVADGATLCALASLAKLCVGIDTGPSHCFGAGGANTLVFWNTNHPVNYYQPMPNVLHLVPQGHARNIRGNDRSKDLGVAYFHRNYQYTEYTHLRRDLFAAVEAKLDTKPIECNLADPTELVQADHGFWIRAALRREDTIVVQDVYGNDCYGLKALGFAPETIVDVGAHIGCFSRLAHELYPAARIVAVEANSRNIPALSRNVGDFAEIIEAACTYEPGELSLASTVYAGSRNSGGSVLVAGDRPAKRLVDVYESLPVKRRVTIEELAERIDVLKIDAEGSEISILRNCDLSHVGVVLLEWHDDQQFNELLATRFQGWRVTFPKGRDHHVAVLRRMP